MPNPPAGDDVLIARRKAMQTFLAALPKTGNREAADDRLDCANTHPDTAGFWPGLYHRTEDVG